MLKQSRMYIEHPMKSLWKNRACKLEGSYFINTILQAGESFSFHPFCLSHSCFMMKSEKQCDPSLPQEMEDGSIFVIDLGNEHNLNLQRRHPMWVWNFELVMLLSNDCLQGLADHGFVSFASNYVTPPPSSGHLCRPHSPACMSSSLYSTVQIMFDMQVLCTFI